jgi:hypothetical protein
VYVAAATSSDDTSFMFAFPPLDPPATSFHGTAWEASTKTLGSESTGK